MERIVFGLSLCLVALFAANTARPCTTFVLEGSGRIYLGRNLDWDWENGLVIINQRGVRKTAFVQPGNAPAQWTSKLQ